MAEYMGPIGPEPIGELAMLEYFRQSGELEQALALVDQLDRSREPDPDDNLGQAYNGALWAWRRREGAAAKLAELGIDPLNPVHVAQVLRNCGLPFGEIHSPAVCGCAPARRGGYAAEQASQPEPLADWERELIESGR